MTDRHTTVEPMSLHDLGTEIYRIIKLEKQKLGFYEAPTELIKGCMAGLEMANKLIQDNREALEASMRPKLRFEKATGIPGEYYLINKEGRWDDGIRRFSSYGSCILFARSHNLEAEFIE